MNPHYDMTYSTVLAIVAQLQKQGVHMSAQLDALTAQVATNTTVVNSALVLIQGLSKQLADAVAAQKNGDDGVALAKLQSDLAASDKALADAVAANTPAAPAPIPAP